MIHFVGSFVPSFCLSFSIQHFVSHVSENIQKTKKKLIMSHIRINHLPAKDQILYDPQFSNLGKSILVIYIETFQKADE